MHDLPPEPEMYGALVRRDPSYEGVFLACVRTTGIFCRPTCRARKPNAENVEYVATAPAALHAGYRPCKICSPLGGEEVHPAWVRPLLEPAGRITDNGLRRRGVEPARARRYFKRHFGVTFHAYQRAWRLGTAMTRLRRGDSISGATYDAGFESESGFREAFAKLFGAPPGRARECLHARWIRTPLGPMIAVASKNGVALLEFVDRRALQRELEFLRRHFDAAVVPGPSDHLDLLEAELAGYFERSSEEFTVALDAPGTRFQRLVWDRLRRIPYGETESYASMARSIGRPGASRAVGRANGGNRIAIVIPCHRVVRADGSLCGYGGGLWRKKRLLEHERATVLA
jgi:AraC family transcriptional regulator of adaptative response/methylated-DNA-[protein]-cysteine methyltransferase